jgi:hypothetical protein
MKCGLVIVETRCIPNIREIVENHIEFTGWPVLFFHGQSNLEFLKEQLKGFEVRFNELPVDNLNEAQYNKLLTSYSFWHSIPYDKILIFQHDSRLLRKGIEEFLEWDYVGAPWLWQKNGGNGGLSLRSRKAMLDIIKAKPYNPATQGNEDVYFANAMYRNANYKLAPRYVCEKFACEAIFKLGTFGYHAISKYMSKEQVAQIQNQYESILAPER